MSENARPALLDFFSQHYEDLKRRLARALGSEDLAGDALHDTWLRLQLTQDRPVEVLRPRAYLQRMAVNMAVDSLRRQHRQVAQADIDAILEVPDPAAGPEQQVAAESELAALMRIISAMPRRRQDILLMVRLGRMKQEEVARRLGVSLSTVEQELRKAHLHCEARMRAARGSR